MNRPFRLACVQTNSGNEIAANLAAAGALARKARAAGAELIAFPECVAMMEVGRANVRAQAAAEESHSALAGFREAIVRDADSRVERHFIILCFASRWRAGEPVLNEELSEAHWLDPAELAGLPTTPGLAEIVAAAFDRLAEAG